MVFASKIYIHAAQKEQRRLLYFQIRFIVMQIKLYSLTTTKIVEPKFFFVAKADIAMYVSRSENTHLQSK